MFELIEKLRGKSEGEKRRFVFLFSASVTLVIAVFWLVAVIFRINSGSLSFEVNAPDGGGIGTIGQRLEESWGDFFPKAEPTVVAGTSTDDASSTSRYPVLEEILGDADSVEATSTDTAE